jgi:predicted NBD/HSP70 family sugar kinase
MKLGVVKMSLMVFDIGGSSVKYGVWANDEIIDKSSFVTPGTWVEMKSDLLRVKQEFAEKYDIQGVAISSPGAVNQKTGVIEGASAVPYIHHFPIFKELQELFGSPIAVENDANCAGLAEVWQGAAKGLKDVIFVVVGSGIGGAMIVNGKIHHGKHLFGGEFGFMLLTDEGTFSTLATPVHMARRYAARKNLLENEVSGKEVFDLAEQGDTVASEEVAKFYRYLAQGIYNLQYSFDPEKIIIGGGVSSMPDLLPNLEAKLQEIIDQVKIAPLFPEIELCHFKNDANLLGAVYNFQLNHSL